MTTQSAPAADDPEGAKNIEVAKDFSKYWIQPEVSGAYPKIGLGRSLPIYAAG